MNTYFPLGKYVQLGGISVNQFSVLEMVLRSTGSFLTLLVMTRLMGKKQINQLTFFHYAAGITIGNIAASISSDTDTPFWNGWVSLVWWALLAIGLSYISLKWSSARMVIEGQPTIVIKKGVLEEKALKRLRLSLEDLSMLLREQAIFSIREVDYAILEPNGKMSVLVTQYQKTATRKDLKLPIKTSKYIPTEIIVDGQIVHKNLIELGLNVQWLEKELNGINHRKVYYAELHADGSLFYQLKQKHL
jgi:uncharacterized membrane protein YcaP (DUF421 family)